MNGLFGSRLPKRRVAAVACALPALAFALTCRMFLQLSQTVRPSAKRCSRGPRCPGSRSMPSSTSTNRRRHVPVVTGVGTLIHIYSIGYMGKTTSFARYFAYLNLFLFFMLLLVLGQKSRRGVRRLGRRGARVVSPHRFLVHGSATRPSAGLKAFVVNRVGDTGFVLGGFPAVHRGRLVRFPGDQRVSSRTHAQTPSAALTTAIALLLLLGACGKSAQIPLHVGCRTRWPARHRCRR